MRRARRCGVGELDNGIGDPAPGSGTVVIAVGRELVRSLLERLFAVALEHQIGGTPDIDLGYHVTKGVRLRLRKA